MKDIYVIITRLNPISAIPLNVVASLSKFSPPLSLSLSLHSGKKKKKLCTLCFSVFALQLLFSLSLLLSKWGLESLRISSVVASTSRVDPNRSSRSGSLQWRHAPSPTPAATSRNPASSAKCSIFPSLIHPQLSLLRLNLRVPLLRPLLSSIIVDPGPTPVRPAGEAALVSYRRNRPVRCLCNPRGSLRPVH